MTMGERVATPEAGAALTDMLFVISNAVNTAAGNAICLPEGVLAIILFNCDGLKRPQIFPDDWLKILTTSASVNRAKSITDL